MIDTVDDEGENAGQDGEGNRDGYDSGSEDDKETDVSAEIMSTCGIVFGFRNTHFVSEFRTLWILSR